MIRPLLVMLALASASPAAAQQIAWPRDADSGQPAVVQPVPRQPMTALVTLYDYPAAALRANVEGEVGIRLTVSAKGKSSDCGIWQSSGSQLLDDWTCGLMKRRAGFAPALDAAGKPTEGKFDHLVIWKITDEIRRANQ